MPLLTFETGLTLTPVHTVLGTRMANKNIDDYYLQYSDTKVIQLISWAPSSKYMWCTHNITANSNIVKLKEVTFF